MSDRLTPKDVDVLMSDVEELRNAQYNQGKANGAAQERREIIALARELAGDGLQIDPITGTLYPSYRPWFYQLSKAIQQRSQQPDESVGLSQSAKEDRTSA